LDQDRIEACGIWCPATSESIARQKNLAMNDTFRSAVEEIRFEQDFAILRSWKLLWSLWNPRTHDIWLQRSLLCLDAPLLPFSIVSRKLISLLAFSRCPRATHHEMIKSGFNFQVLHGRRRSEALNLKWTDLIERPHVAWCNPQSLPR
jgi:integrase